jgi:SlyX protein
MQQNIDSETQERLVNIEMKISHQDLIIEDLNQVVYQQQQTIDMLSKKLKLIEDQFRADPNIGPAGEKPPHY